MVIACRVRDFAPVPGSFALAANLLQSEPLVSLRINDVTSNNFILDTGEPGSVLIFDRFFRAHPDEAKYFTAEQQSTRGGVGGSFAAQTYKVREIQLGDVAFREFPIDRVMSHGSYDLGFDGAVGASFLSYFTIGLDYYNWKIYLKPNGRR
jgi:hypothetical protein